MVAARMPDPCSKKYYTVCVPEFGSEFIGKTAIIVRGKYGLKSSGDAFRNHLHDCMEHLGYESCKADLDVLMQSCRSFISVMGNRPMNSNSCLGFFLQLTRIFSPTLYW